MRGARLSIDRCLGAAYAVLERLVPHDDTVCFISFPPVEDNAFAVFTEILRRGDQDMHRLIWLTTAHPRVGMARLRVLFGSETASRCRVFKRKSLRGLWYFLRARRVYFTHSHYRFVRRGRTPNRLINLWHGMPLKAIGLLDPDNKAEVPASDLTIASSAFFQQIMARAIGLPLANVLVTGLPRCDQLAGSSDAARKLRQSLLQRAERLVIWMPTYRFNIVGPSRTDSVSSREACVTRFVQDLSTLSELGQAHGCAVVVKLHPMDFLTREELPALKSVNVLRPDSPELTACGLYDLLAVTDGLITDVSSVCFDYMSTRRPILITRDFVSSYTRGLLFDPAALFAAVFTSQDWQGAEAFFEAVRAGETLDPRALAQFCEFADANSAARVLDGIDALDREASASHQSSGARRELPASSASANKGAVVFPE